MIAHSIESGTHLAPRTYALIGLGLLALGLTISGVSGAFYIAGLDRIEVDPEVRSLRVLFVVLAIVAHATFFGVGAFLRHDRFKSARRALTALACLLLLEITTVYVTKVVLAHGAAMTASDTDGRVQQLQAQIDANRRTAAALREAGERSSDSIIASSRADGARSIRQAADLDARNEVLIAELARAQSERRPTAVDVLGADGMRLLSAAASIAFVLAGVAAVSAGGLLLGIARSQSAAARAAAEVTAPTAPRPEIAPQATAPTAPAGDAPHRETAVATAPPYSVARRWAAASVPAAAIPVVFAAPVMPVIAPSYQQAVYSAPVAATPTAATPLHSNVEREAHAPAVEVQTNERTALEDEVESGTMQSAETAPQCTEVQTAIAPAQDSVTAPQPELATAPRPVESPSGDANLDPRYAQILAAVQSGEVTPSIRAIQAVKGGGTDIVRGYLKRMENDGVLVRAVRGYRLAL